MNTSTKYQLNKTDAIKIARGGLVTLVGAILAYLGSIYLNINYSFVIKGVEMNLTPIATVIIGAIIEAGRRWVTNYSAVNNEIEVL